MRKSLLTLGLLMTAGLVGCSAEPSSATPGPIRIVTTTGMIADLVRSVGGDQVQVEALMGPGVDPHRYTPTPGDLGKINDAQLVFFNGLHLEGKMTDLLEADPRAVAVTRELKPAELRPADGDGLAHDPHVWFDIKLWSRCIPVVRDALIAADPEQAETYRSNAERTQREYEALDQEVRKQMESIPQPRRVLVTSHDAFGYFGAAYGFEVHGLQGVSTAAETPLSDVQELARFLGSRDIPAVFGESSVPPRGLQKVLDTVRSEYGRTVRLIGDDDALYSDALGPSGSGGDTYPGMVRHNIAVITRALSGQ